MRILQINKFFYLRGGAERHFFDVCDLLSSKGHDVIHFSMKDKRNRKSPYSKYFVSGVHYDKYNWTAFIRWGRVIYSPQARRKLSLLIKDTKPDIAHIHLMYHHLSPSILLALKEAGIPTVMTIHDWQPLCPNYNLYAKGKVCNDCKQHKYFHVFKNKAIKNSYFASALAAFAGWLHHKKRWYEDLVQKYIAPSKFVRDLFLEYGWPKDQIIYIPHFVSHIPKLNPDIKKKRAILYAGRLYPQKGIGKLVKYWIDNNIDAQLHIAGRGPLEEYIKNIVKSAGAENNIKLLGFLELPELMRHMSTVAAIIIPSLSYETFGLATIEAWAAGTGVLANNIGPLPEIVKAGKGGVIFNFSDKKNNLKTIIDHYMENEEQWNIYGKMGYLYVKKELTKEKFYNRLMDLYNTLI